MNAAIYARYSTDKQTESSIRDQVRVCTEWASAAGIKVAATFKDEGISGAAIGNRPGFLAMMDASKTGDFDVLLVMDLSRLSRNQGDLPKSLERLAHVGVRVVGVQDGYDSDRKGHKLQAGFSGIMGEWFREMVADKTYAALESRAKAGKRTGGRSYGYTKSGEVDLAQVKVVRQIFEMYAEGMSALSIASELNRKGVPSPGSTWNRQRRRKSKWLASAISGDPRKGLGILNNEKYQGVVIWNRSHWIRDPDTGKYRAVRRPDTEWITHEEPELRIVDDALWNRVRSRQRQQAKSLGVAVKSGLAEASRHSGRGPKWLLSGLLKCGDCGASLVMTDAHHYSCSTYRNGGKSACGNGIRVKRELAETKLLIGIKTQLLTPKYIEKVQREVRRVLVERQRTAGAEVEVQQKRLRVVQGEIKNIVQAIKAGLLTPATKAELDACESEKVQLEAAVVMGDGSTQNVIAMIPRVAERFRTMVNGLERRAAKADPRTYARAKADLKQFLGEVRVEVEKVDGVRVPVAVLQGNSRAILRVVGAESSAIDKYGSGGTLEPKSLVRISIRKAA